MTEDERWRTEDRRAKTYAARNSLAVGYSKSIELGQLTGAKGTGGPRDVRCPVGRGEFGQLQV
jgi:hypothetical protein